RSEWLKFVECDRVAKCPRQERQSADDSCAEQCKQPSLRLTLWNQQNSEHNPESQQQQGRFGPKQCANAYQQCASCGQEPVVIRPSQAIFNKEPAIFAHATYEKTHRNERCGRKDHGKYFRELNC